MPVFDAATDRGTHFRDAWIDCTVYDNRTGDRIGVVRVVAIPSRDEILMCSAPGQEDDSPSWACYLVRAVVHNVRVNDDARYAHNILLLVDPAPLVEMALR